MIASSELDTEAPALWPEPDELGLGNDEALYLVVAAYVHTRPRLASRDPPRVQGQDRAQPSLRLALQLHLDRRGTSTRHDSDKIGPVHDIARPRQTAQLPSPRVVDQ